MTDALETLRSQVEAATRNTPCEGENELMDRIGAMEKMSDTADRVIRFLASDEAEEILAEKLFTDHFRRPVDTRDRAGIGLVGYRAIAKSILTEIARRGLSDDK